MRNVNRIALGLTYNGNKYIGWQSQPSNNTIQDKLEIALNKFAGHGRQRIIKTICSGRTDAGVHGLMQVVHFDSDISREPMSWIRGTNTYLPNDIAVQWAKVVPEQFHARACSLTRRYIYILLESPVRPSLEFDFVGWSFIPLDINKLNQAKQYLIGEHDFSSFRAAACQSPSPIKNLLKLDISYSNRFLTDDNKIYITNQRSLITHPKYWRFEFEANAFLHHMIRNIMGALLVVGSGEKDPSWIKYVLEAKNREISAPTFSANGLYFAGPTYDPKWQIPKQTPSIGWLPI